MAKKKSTPRAKKQATHEGHPLINQLTKAIGDYVIMCRADEMKGGGDPDDIPIIEAELTLARLRMMQVIQKIREALNE